MDAKLEKELEKQVKKEQTKGQNKVWLFVRENLAKIALVPISIIYIIYGLFMLQKKDATIVEIIGSIIISIVMGTAIAICMMNAGLNDAKKTPEFKEKVKDFNDVKKEAVEYQDKLPTYCNMKNIRELEETREDILQSVLLDAKLWKLGYYDKHKEDLTMEQIIALNRVKNVKIDKTTSRDLMSSDTANPKKNKYGKYGKNKREYLTQKNVQGVLITLIVSIVFGYYSLEPLFNEDTLSTLVWNIFQIVMWLALGIIKYCDAKSFMLDEFAENNIVTKTNILREFIAIMKKRPQLLEDFETEQDKKIKEFLKEQEEQNNECNKEENNRSTEEIWK